MTKAIDHQSFQEKLLAFSEQSMTWCAKQAEASVESTTNVITILLQDATRVSKMSAETKAALNTLKAHLADKSKIQANSKTKTIIATLKSLSAQNLEMGEFATPIIETLQFQDRIRQNMENLGKMTKIWMTERSIQTDHQSNAAEALKSFGEKLLKATTMQSERNVVRKFIPGLPEEQKTEDVLLF